VKSRFILDAYASAELEPVDDRYAPSCPLTMYLLLKPLRCRVGWGLEGTEGYFLKDGTSVCTRRDANSLIVNLSLPDLFIFNLWKGNLYREVRSPHAARFCFIDGSRIHEEPSMNWLLWRIENEI